MVRKQAALVADRGEKEDGPHPINRLKFEVEKGAPSSPAHPQVIQDTERIFGCNRRFETVKIPLALLHPAFGIFKDRLQRIHLPREMPQSHIGLDFLEQKIAGTEYTTDGNFPVIVMPAAIRKCKNEHGEPIRTHRTCCQVRQAVFGARSSTSGKSLPTGLRS
jgi:hypothetical protein